MHDKQACHHRVRAECGLITISNPLLLCAEMSAFLSMFAEMSAFLSMFLGLQERDTTVWGNRKSLGGCGRVQRRIPNPFQGNISSSRRCADTLLPLTVFLVLVGELAWFV